jgi:pectate lyase
MPARATALSTALALALASAGAAGCSDRRLVPIRPIGSGIEAGAITCGADLIGFASLSGGTTGGQGGETVVVSTLTDLRTNAAVEAPLIIQIDGMIALSEQVKVAANKTIVGRGAASGLIGSGFNLGATSNVILQNLVISKAVGTDAVTVENSHNVWIDHCDLSSDRDHGKVYYDDLIDVLHGSDYVTVSWTRFQDHFETSNIGTSDDDGAEETGHLTVTFHHNLFLRTYSHNPSLRFGLLHVLNNYYLDVDGGGVFSRMSGQVLAEGNYFDTVAMIPLTTHYQSPTDGFLTDENNVFKDSGTPYITQTTDWTPPYPYSIDKALNVPDIVSECAGAGKLNL